MRGAEAYLATDASAFNQTVTPGWPQIMVDIRGEDNAAEVKVSVSRCWILLGVL
ncbi:MAG: hypothetical protein ACLS2X_00675 [Coprococcus sp.]